MGVRQPNRALRSSRLFCPSSLSAVLAASFVLVFLGDLPTERLFLLSLQDRAPLARMA